MKNSIDREQNRNGNITIFITLQVMNIIFSLDSVLIKCASVSWEENGLFSWNTILFLTAAVGVLGIYAVVWQMILARVKLAVAYLSKGLVIFWGLIWSVLFFKEQITGLNLLGAAVIFGGTLLVNDYE